MSTKRIFWIVRHPQNANLALSQDTCGCHYNYTDNDRYEFSFSSDAREANAQQYNDGGIKGKVVKIITNKATENRPHKDYYIVEALIIDHELSDDCKKIAYLDPYHDNCASYAYVTNRGSAAHFDTIEEAHKAILISMMDESGMASVFWAKPVLIGKGK